MDARYALERRRLTTAADRAHAGGTAGISAISSRWVST